MQITDKHTKHSYNYIKSNWKTRTRRWKRRRRRRRRWCRRKILIFTAAAAAVGSSKDLIIIFFPSFHSKNKTKRNETKRKKKRNIFLFDNSEINELNEWIIDWMIHWLNDWMNATYANLIDYSAIVIYCQKRIEIVHLSKHPVFMKIRKPTSQQLLHL